MTTENTEQSEIEHKLQYLQGSPRERALALQGLSGTPLPDRRLLTICEALLQDRTIALLTIPYSYGEIRWCAADAVASLRRVLKISEPVVVQDVFAPVSTAQVVELEKAAGLNPKTGVNPKSGVDGVIETLETLAKMDRLPRRTITRRP